MSVLINWAAGARSFRPESGENYLSKDKHGKIVVDPHEVAICTIHGNSPYYCGEFAARYAWPKLQISQLRKVTSPGFKVFAYGNRLMEEHETFLRGCSEVEYISSRDVTFGEHEHVWPIRNWLSRRAARAGFKWIVHLDSDAFPVEPWLEHYCSLISEQFPVVAVERNQDGDSHSDRCFLMFSVDGYDKHHFDFSNVGERDAGAGISSYLEERQLDWHRLKYSNARTYHYCSASIHDDRIYHHGAGSRIPAFRRNFSTFQHEELKQERDIEVATHRLLMKRIFDDTDNFIAQLRGAAEDENFEFSIRAEMDDLKATGALDIPLITNYARQRPRFVSGDVPSQWQNSGLIDFLQDLPQDKLIALLKIARNDLVYLQDPLNSAVLVHAADSLLEQSRLDGVKALSPSASFNSAAIAEPIGQNAQLQSDDELIIIDEVQNISFGDSVFLLFMKVFDKNCGVEVVSEWRASRHPELAVNLAVHIIDDSGQILRQADHRLFQAVPKPGQQWQDRFRLSRLELSGASALGIAVYDDPSRTLLIGEGRRDWDNHRLLLDFTKRLS